MIAFITSAPSLGGVLAVSYLAGGIVVAGLLERAGQPRSAVLGAFVAWPMLLPLLKAPPEPAPRPAAAGPYHQRIDAVLASLAETLADPAATEVPLSCDLDVLRRSLFAADARLALVDRLLADPTGPEGGLDRSLARLREARAKSAAAIEAVLVELLQLRLAVGVVALAGESTELRDRLRELSARASALGELAQEQV